MHWVGLCQLFVRNCVTLTQNLLQLLGFQLTRNNLKETTTVTIESTLGFKTKLKCRLVNDAQHSTVLLPFFASMHA